MTLDPLSIMLLLGGVALLVDMALLRIGRKKGKPGRPSHRRIIAVLTTCVVLVVIAAVALYALPGRLVWVPFALIVVSGLLRRLLL